MDLKIAFETQRLSVGNVWGGYGYFFFGGGYRHLEGA